MHLSWNFFKQKPRWQIPVFVLAFVLCSLFLVACSDTPTAAPNPLQVAAEAGNPQATTNSASAATATPGTNSSTSPAATQGQAATSGEGSGNRTSGQATPTPVGADNRQVVRLWTSGWKGNTDYETFLNNLIDNYRTKYSKTFTLDWQDYGGDLDNKLADTFAKNPKALPDLVLLNIGDLYQFAASDKLEDLGPQVGTEVQNRFATQAWEATRYPFTNEGGNFGLPWLASTRISLINKKLWQDATLDPTKLPKNFDELDQYLPLMRDKTAKDVRAVWLKPDSVADFLMEGVTLYTLNANGKPEPAFNIPAAQGKWQYYFNRRKDGYFSTEALEGTYKDTLTRYAGGKLVMVLDGAPILPDLKNQSPDVYSNTLVLTHPLSKGNILPLQIQAWSVPKGAPNKREAIPFALFLDNDENQLAFAKLVQTSIPTTKKALQDPFVQSDDEPLSRARSLMAQALPQTRPAEQLIPAPLPLATRDKLLNALFVAQGATWSKAVKPQDALAEATKAWADLLK